MKTTMTASNKSKNSKKVPETVTNKELEGQQQDDMRIERFVKFQKKMRKGRKNPWSLCCIPLSIANQLNIEHGETVAVKLIDGHTVQIRKINKQSST